MQRPVGSALPRPWRRSLAPTRLPIPKVGEGMSATSSHELRRRSCGHGQAAARARAWASGAGVGEWRLGRRCRGGEDLRGRRLRRRESRAPGSRAPGVMMSWAQSDACGVPVMGVAWRVHAAAVAPSNDDVRTRQAACAASCSGAPEFASLPAGACCFTGSSASSTASAVAIAMTAAAEPTRSKRMPDRGRARCAAVRRLFCPRTVRRPPVCRDPR